MRSSWNRGLTKETDPRIARSAEKYKDIYALNLRRYYANSGHPWNKGLTKETDSRIGSWNKGLTQETDPRVARQAHALKQTYEKGQSAEHIQKRVASYKQTIQKMGGSPLKGHPQSVELKEKRRQGILEFYANGGHSWAKGRTIPRDSEEYYKKAEHCRQIASHPKESNPNWKGGISTFPYPPSFNKRLRRSIKLRDGGICQECGRQEADCAFGPIVHHIDYNKANSNLNNLICLCQACNSKANFQRVYWKSHLGVKMAVRGIVG